MFTLNPQGVKVAENGIILISKIDICGITFGGEELFLENFCLISNMS
jgi:hypothetical protein